MAQVAARAATVLAPALLSAAKPLVKRVGKSMLKGLTSPKVIKFAKKHKEGIKNLGNHLLPIISDTIKSHNNNKRNNTNTTAAAAAAEDDTTTITSEQNTWNKKIEGGILVRNKSHDTSQNKHVNWCMDTEYDDPNCIPQNHSKYHRQVGKGNMTPKKNTQKYSKEENVNGTLPETDILINYIIQTLHTSPQFLKHTNSSLHTGVKSKRFDLHRTLLHSIIFALCSFRNEIVSTKASKECPICILQDNESRYSVDEFDKKLDEACCQVTAIITTNRESVATILSTHYSINIYIIQRLLRKIKRTYNSEYGTFGYDITLTVLDSYKQHSIKVGNFFCGTLYQESLNGSHDGPINGFDKSLDTLFTLHPIKDVKTLSYIYGTGTSVQPLHWCAIFVDFELQTFFFYDSLNKQTKIQRFFNILQKRQPNLRFIANEYAHQYGGSFCGVYASRFIIKMLMSTDRKNTFATCFNSANIGNQDEKMKHMQHETVAVSSSLSTTLMMFLENII